MLSWRDAEVPRGDDGWKSRVANVVVSNTDMKAVEGKLQPSAVGWEKNVHGKLGPRVADLVPMMDPARYICVHCVPSISSASD